MRQRKTPLWVLGTVVFVILVSGNPVFGAGTFDGQDYWRFTFAPYVWALGINGDMTVRNRSVDLDVGFDDILSNLDLAAMVHMEVQRGRWGLVVDPNYASLSVDQDTPLGTAEVSTDFLIVEYGVLYRVVEVGGSGPDLEPTGLEIIGGGRTWSLDTEIKTPGDQTGERSTSWTDPFIGLRALFHYVWFI